MSKKEYKTQLILFALFAKFSRSIRPQPPSYENVLEAFEQGMAFSQGLRTACKDCFEQVVRAEERPLESYVLATREQFRNKPQTLLRSLLALLALAQKGSTIPHYLNEHLLQISQRFGFSREEYLKLRQYFVSGELCPHESPPREEGRTQEALRILGCKSSDSNIEIRRAYRRLVLAHHPDLFVSVALSDEARRSVFQQFTQIQQAYEMLKEFRDIR